MFKPVSAQVDFAKLEEEVLKYWKENKTFEKSLSKDAPQGDWTFLDGPPFITGTPHYGTLLSSIPKDLMGRFWTMKGFRVRRVWGWDGHGLPIENKVEEKLKIKRKKDIEEKVGVKKFIEECLKYVNEVSGEWEWYVDHIGRWVDFKNAYKTWDINYMESVMWVFKQMYDKGLIYQGLRVCLFCPHCSTPVSNFEIASDPDNYKNVTEPTAVYKYQLKDEQDTFLLAWSTTPWNKLVTPALAVNPKLTYVKVTQGKEKYILAKSTLKLLKDNYEKIAEFKGQELVGKEFVSHYTFYKIDPDKKAFIVVGGNFVTADEGTGIVTLAVYGEEDLMVMQRDNIQLVMHLDDEGIIEDFVPKFAGMNYLEANRQVIDDLSDRGLVYRVDQYSHSVPHCWRCGTRLYYAPKDAWFVDVQTLKPKLFKNNEAINWFPKHFKMGRFAKSMEAAPDWNISRNRYWGSPVPVWMCQCGKSFVPGSIRELEEASGSKITNLHKPDIDEVEVRCKKCDKKVKRVPEVLDSWIEAGSASFAERHFPFEKDLKLEDFFPPDFITEYTGQIRAWFYVIHVITTALYDSPGFKNVLVSGVLLGTDGRKMSKNYGNFPDPKEIMEKYGGDALRLYLMGSSLMKGEDINFSEEGVAENFRFLLIFWNTYKFFTDYASLSKWDNKPKQEKLTVLDRWILAKLAQLTLALNKTFAGYDPTKIVSLLRNFIINDFSTWYIRRSRDRVGPEADSTDRNICLSVMYEILLTLSKLAAPLIPFISEEIYRNLTAKESVHLEDYPTADKHMLDDELVSQVRLIREIAEKAHAKRKEVGIKLRQPLASLNYKIKEKLSVELEQILVEELNVKKVEYEKTSSDKQAIELDTNITLQLREEGGARDLIRQVQQLRKEQGLTLADKTRILAPSWPKKFEDLILKNTASVSISQGEILQIIKSDEDSKNS